MNRLIIVGNGFDLAHGLKTSYVDFLFYYFSNAVQSAFLYGQLSGYKDQVIEIDSLIAKEFQRNDTLGDLSNLDALKLMLKYRNSQGQKLISIQSEFLELTCSNLEQSNWVDVEKTYSDLLVEIMSELTKMSLKAKIEHRKKIFQLNKDFEFIKSQLEYYLMLVEDNYIKNGNVMRDSIDNCLFGSSKINKVDKLRDKIFVLSFNYTSLINQYAENVSLEKTIKYVHGEINGNNKVLFGYGDTKSEKYDMIIRNNDPESMRFFKNLNAEMNDSYVSLKTFMNSGHFELVVAGHSCGISDSYLLSDVLNHDKCAYIRLLHYKRPDGKYDYTDKRTNLEYHINKEVFKIEKIAVFDYDDYLR